MHLREIALELKKTYNRTCVEINQLPLEILTTILSLDLRSLWEGQSSMRYRRRALASVSSQWRTIMTGMPGLWSDLRSDQADVGLALKRSGDAELRVACRPVNSGYHIAYPYKFMSDVREHTERWTEGWFRVREEARAIGQSLERPTPRLRVLSVVFEAELYAHRNILLQPGLPLQHVNLERTRIPWGSCRLTGLRSLELCRLEGGLPSLDRLRGILEESPRLERLALLGLGVGIEGCYGCASPTELPNLTSLFIADVPTAMMDFLLSSIRTTNLRSLILHHVGWHHVPTDQQGSALSQLVPSALNAQNVVYLTGKSNKEIAIGTGSVGMGAWADGWEPWPYRRDVNATHFHVMVEVPDYATGMIGLSKFLHSMSPTAAVILQPKCITWTDGPAQGSAEDFPVEVLDELPEIYGISMTSRAQAIKILGHLATCKEDEGLRQYPCPQLGSLDLSRVSDVTEALGRLRKEREVEKIILPGWDSRRV